MSPTWEESASVSGMERGLPRQPHPPPPFVNDPNRGGGPAPGRPWTGGGPPPWARAYGYRRHLTDEDHDQDHDQGEHPVPVGVPPDLGHDRGEGGPVGPPTPAPGRIGIPFGPPGVE